MPFSIVIPWRYNPAREVLFRNVIDCIERQAVRTEIIIVEQCVKEEDVESWKRLLNLIPRTTENNYIKTTHAIGEFSFNKSWLMNIGAKKVTNEYIIFMDADTIFGDDFFCHIREYIKNENPVHKDIFFCWNNLIALPGKDNPNQRTIRPENTVAMGGIWGVNKDFYFEKLRGMNESYFGYGGEDNDMYDRATYVRNMPAIYSMMRYTLTHQYHDWEKPAENAANYSFITRKYAKEIQERLDKVELGRMEGPTIISMEVEETK